MNHHQRSEMVKGYNDGNFVNGDAPERFEEEPVKCGYCGDTQEDPDAKACNCCLNDEYIKNLTNGR